MVKEHYPVRATRLPAGSAITWPAPEPGLFCPRGNRSGLTISALPTPKPGKVHVWAASLEVPTPILEAFENTLSSDERVRAAKFHFSEDRNRYIVARGWLRQLLGRYVSIPASAVEFVYGPKGKPALAGSTTSAELQFNMAHSEDLALVAVARGASVGIDLERVRALEDAGDLVERFFSSRENAQFKSLPDGQKPLAFFNLWTRKEAWLKATGEGIAHQLSTVEVSFAPGTSAQLLSVPCGFAASSNWTMCDLIPGPGFAGAVVVAGSGAETECRLWEYQSFGL
jgi:4'-phosphopantetheinyl transferase